MKAGSTKSHETTRKPNITKKYFGVVSCDLVDRSCFSSVNNSNQDITSFAQFGQTVVKRDHQTPVRPWNPFTVPSQLLTLKWRRGHTRAWRTTYVTHQKLLPDIRHNCPGGWQLHCHARAGYQT